MARLFVSQERIDRWAHEGKVSVVGDVMSLPALGRSFRLRPAVYMVRVVSENADEHQLLGRVKTEAQLQKIGAETVADSVVLGEVAYQCETGYVGEVVGGSQPLSSTSVEKIEH